MSMNTLVIGCAIIGIAFSTLGIILRIVDRRLRWDVANTLLNVGLFAALWHVFIYLMILTGYIRHLPDLYNKGIPLYYLIAPCMYFYVQYRLYPPRDFPKRVYLHAIPFVFGLVDIMPYALASQAEKQALMERLIENISTGFAHEYGFVPQHWHYLIKLSLAFLYLMLQWRLLFRVDREETGTPARVVFELYLFTVIYTLFIVVQVGMVLNIIFNRIQSTYILKDLSQLIWISILYLLLSVWICLSTFLRRTK